MIIMILCCIYNMNIFPPNNNDAYSADLSIKTFTWNYVYVLIAG